MVGISYALVDFVSGGPIVDLSVMEEGATWAAQLNRPDTLSCKVDLRDAEMLALDLRSASEPKKTILLARDDDDNILAWGLIDDDRAWDEDARTLTLNAKGVTGSWLGAKIIGPVAARTATLTTNGAPNLSLDTTITGFGLGTIGKKLVAQALTWPNGPTWWQLPADEVADRTETYPFSNFKRVGAALSDLSDRENGPDFAFDLFRAPDGLSVVCVMRHGSEATPAIGKSVGVWPLTGTASPISKFLAVDSSSDLATAAWGVAGRQNDTVMLARSLTDSMIASGYPPLDYVDTSHSDVVVQSTLNAYARANASRSRRPIRSLSFNVQADASPRLGEYRPGDRVTIDVGDSHPYLTKNFDIRITSISGDAAGKAVGIGCEVM